MNQFHIAEWRCCGILPSREGCGTNDPALHVTLAGSGEAIPSDSFKIPV